MKGYTANAAVNGFAQGLSLVKQMQYMDEATQDRKEARAERARTRDREEMTQLSPYMEKEMKLADYDHKLAQGTSDKLTNETAQFKLGKAKRDDMRAQGAEALRTIYSRLERGEQVDPGLLYDTVEKYELDPRLMVSGDYSDAVSKMEDVFEGRRASGDKEALEGFNKLFAPQINRGVGTVGKDGGKIISKRVTRAIPHEDGNDWSFELEVTTDKGKYKAPVSKFRGTDDDVLKVSGEEIADHVRGIGLFDQFLDQTGLKKSLADQITAMTAASSSGSKWRVLPSGGMTFNEATGEKGINNPNMKASPSLAPEKLAIDMMGKQSQLGFPPKERKSYAEWYQIFANNPAGLSQPGMPGQEGGDAVDQMDLEEVMQQNETIMKELGLDKDF